MIKFNRLQISAVGEVYRHFYSQEAPGEDYKHVVSMIDRTLAQGANSTSSARLFSLLNRAAQYQETKKKPKKAD